MKNTKKKVILFSAINVFLFCLMVIFTVSNSGAKETSKRYMSLTPEKPKLNDEQKIEQCKLLTENIKKELVTAILNNKNYSNNNRTIRIIRTNSVAMELNECDKSHIFAFLNSKITTTNPLYFPLYVLL